MPVNAPASIPTSMVLRKSGRRDKAAGCRSFFKTLARRCTSPETKAWAVSVTSKDGIKVVSPAHADASRISSSFLNTAGVDSPCAEAMKHQWYSPRVSMGDKTTGASLLLHKDCQRQR